MTLSRFSDGENKTSLGIFYTNDMTFTDESAALFPTMARANHSCTPNSDFVARHELGKSCFLNCVHLTRKELCKFSKIM
jgi:hypothetical protein